jgi:hypothetical protein
MMTPNDFKQNSQLARLMLYQKHLSNNNVSARLIEAENEASLNILVASIGEIQVQISFVPIPEDHYQAIEIMQFFIELGSFSYPIDSLQTLCNALNQKMALGKIILDSEGKLEMRYYTIVAKAQPMEEVTFAEFFATFLTSVEFVVEIISSGLPLEGLLEKIKGY